MSELTSFVYAGAPVRTVDVDGDPWFVALDVALVLGYRDAHNLIRRLDEDEKGTRSLSTPGGVQRLAIVSEAGLYSAVLGSKVPGARAFKRWVTSEVLPSIRKTGAYKLDLTTPEGVLELAKQLTVTAQGLVAEKQRRLELEGPAAEREAYRQAEGLQLIGDIANRFIPYAASRFLGVKVTHDLVRDHAGRLGIVIRGNTTRNNQPTAEAVRSGWARASDKLIDTNHGQLRKVTAKLTPRGEARLWDGMCSYILEHGTLDLPQRGDA